jgi:transcriptional regulator with XRE-family HTH domain
MASDAAPGIGEHVRFYRRSQHKQQVAVAGLAQISVRYLREIERGLKTPSLPLLYRLAVILSVPPAALLGDHAVEVDNPAHPAMAAIRRALMGLDRPEPAEAPPDLVGLRRHVDAARTAWLTSPARYSEAGRRLPDLILGVDRATHTFSAAGEASARREAHRLAAEVYFLCRAFFGSAARLNLNLAMLAADRAVRAAEYADDPLRIAISKWERGHALLSSGDLEATEDVVLGAARELRPHVDGGSPRFAAAYGALHLVAAISAVRRNDVWTARRWLRSEAQPAAERSGESNLFLTSFGPANVGLHEISIAAAAGEASEGLRLADTLDIGPLRSVGRRCTYFVELARCYDQRREDLAALVHLQRAEREAPEELRYSVFAHDLLRSLIRRARPSYLSEVRAFAERLGIYA